MKVLFRFTPSIKQAVQDDIKELIAKELNLNHDRDEISVISTSEDEKYQTHYLTRAITIHDGILFLLKSLSPANDFTQQLIKSFNATYADYEAFLRKLATDQRTATDIALFQNSLANYKSHVVEQLSHTLHIKKSKMRKMLARAEQFALIKTEKPTVVTTSKLGNTSIIQIDKPEAVSSDFIKELSDIKTDDKNQLPEWYKNLDNHEKKFIQTLINDPDFDSKNSYNTISARLRLIPTTANYATHTLMTLDPGAEPIIYPSEIRSSHIGSRDLKSADIALRQEYAKRNLNQLIEDAIAKKKEELEKTLDQGQPGDTFEVRILYQTLVTPLPIKQEDYQLQQDKDHAVKVIQQELDKEKVNINGWDIIYRIYPTNHALNVGKHALQTTEFSDSGKVATSLSSEPDPDPSCLYSQAANALRKLINTKIINKLLDPYRELYLSSLEQLVVGELNGISIGSCVSGKDRKAIEIDHTDAMRVYFSQYKSLPPFQVNSKADRVARRNFAAIFATIHGAKHQSSLASLNAPGAFGIKTPAMYLPDFLKTAVDKWHEENTRKRHSLKESNLFAKNNAFAEIKKTKKFVTWIKSLFTRKPAWSPKSVQAPPTLQVQSDNVTTDLASFVQAAKSGLQNYLDKRNETLGLFSKFFDEERGRLRAQTYLELLSDTNIKPQYQFLLLYALLHSNDGKTLQKAIVNELGFINREAAATAMFHYLSSFEAIKRNPEITSVTLSTLMMLLNSLDHSNVGSIKDDIISAFSNSANQAAPIPGSQP